MGIIQRYLLKEILLTWIAVTIVLLSIVVTNRLVGYLADAAAGDLPSSVIFDLLGLKVISYFSLLAPFSLFIGILLAIGRLNRDSEMSALGACGVGEPYLYRTLLLLVLPLTAAMAWLSLQGAPGAAQESYRIQNEAQQTAEISGIRAGRFQESKTGDRVFLIENISDDHQLMENVFIETHQNNKLQHTVSQTGYLEFNQKNAGKYLVLQDGYRYEGLPGEMNYRVVQYEKMRVLLQEAQEMVVQFKRDASPTSVLMFSDELGDIAELQWRISVPLSVFLMAMLAIPLSKAEPREGRYGRIVIGILLYTVYANLQIVAKAWVEQGKVPVAVGMWWVHVLVLIGIFVMLYQANLFRRIPLRESDA